MLARKLRMVGVDAAVLGQVLPYPYPYPCPYPYPYPYPYP